MGVGRGGRLGFGVGVAPGGRLSPGAGVLPGSGSKVGKTWGVAAGPTAVGTGVATGVGLTSAMAGVLLPKPRRIRKPAPTRMTTTATRPTMAAMPLPCSLGRIRAPRGRAADRVAGRSERQPAVSAEARDRVIAQSAHGADDLGRGLRGPLVALLAAEPGDSIAGMLPQKRSAAPRTHP